MAKQIDLLGSETRGDSRAEPRVSAKRIQPLRRVKVASKTLGTLITYNLTMENASRTGLLLTTARNQRVPYHVNTLIELTIDPSGEILDKPAPCLARVVRAMGMADGTAHIGVHLIMMEPRDESSWTDALSCLGSEDGEETAALLAAS